MGGRVDEFMSVGSGTHDPYAPNADGPILGFDALHFQQPIDLPTHVEPGYRPYPFGTLASVIGVPAVSPTAAVGVNPWDASLGHYGSIPGSPDIEGAQPLIMGAQPETGM